MHLNYRFPKLFSSDVNQRLVNLVTDLEGTIDRQLDSQPREVRFCRRCVVSNQRPRIVMDSEGICSACRFADRKQKEIDWADRESQLLALLERHRKSDGSYDCIVPGSGGKDSSMVAHMLKKKYGMNPLTVTWAPFMYTEIGFQNFYNFVQSGFDNLTCWPNGHIHRKLARLSFDLLGDAWQPFAYGQLNYAFQMAMRFDIKLVFFGENGEAEYGGSTKGNDSPSFHWDDWKEVYLKGAIVDDLVARGTALDVFSEQEAREVSDFYRLPDIQILQKKDIQFHWLSYYRKWVPQENYYYARENTGFEANPDGRSEGTYSKYASLDDCTDGFHFYLAYVKFGIGRATSDAAHEIRDGHITRDEATALVRRYDGEFPAKYFDSFKEYIGIDDRTFEIVVDRYRSPHLWERTNNGWGLRHAVWHDKHQLEALT